MFVKCICNENKNVYPEQSKPQKKNTQNLKMNKNYLSRYFTEEALERRTHMKTQSASFVTGNCKSK
jgi:hypothetical protein